MTAQKYTFKIYPPEADVGCLQEIIMKCEKLEVVPLDVVHDHVIPIVDMGWMWHIGGVHRLPEEVSDKFPEKECFSSFLIYELLAMSMTSNWKKYRVGDSIYEDYNPKRIVSGRLAWKDLKIKEDSIIDTADDSFFEPLPAERDDNQSDVESTVEDEQDKPADQRPALPLDLDNQGHDTKRVVVPRKKYRYMYSAEDDRKIVNYMLEGDRIRGYMGTSVWRGLEKLQDKLVDSTWQGIKQRFITIIKYCKGPQRKKNQLDKRLTSRLLQAVEASKATRKEKK